jgi:putative ABC transport system permease protein
LAKGGTHVLAVTFADLWFRARQFLIAIVGVALVLGLALALSGLADGFYSEVADTVDAVGATSWVMSSAAQGRLTAFAAFPAAEQRAVADEPGVRRASAVLFVPSTVALVSGSTQPLSVNLFGFQRNGLGDPRVASGRPLAAPDQVVVDSKVASVGSVLIIGGHRFDVVGTVDNRTMTGGVPLVYMTLPAAQQAVTGGKPLITAIATAGTPAALPAGLVVLSPPAVVTATVSQLKSGVESIDNTRWLMWFVAAAIVASMLYVAALERKRDFAVLKALGSSSRALFLSLVLEAVVVTLLAAVLAEALASLLTPAFAQPVAISTEARLVLPLIAVAVGVVASITALRRVTGADPAAAFG